MNRNLVIAACLLFALWYPALGQRPQKVQEPEYLGTFYVLDPSTGNLSRLERQTPENRMKYAGAMGVGGAQGYMKIEGAKSPVRFKEGQKLEFVVLVASQQIDPLDIVSFFALESNKDNRRLVKSKAKSVFGVTSDKLVVGDSEVAFEASKYGVSSFKVIPTQILLPGEYVLFGSSPKVGFCFGIDADLAYQASRPGLVFPFRTGESIPLGIVEQLVTIKSVEVSSWPKPADLQKAEGLPDVTTNLTMKFTSSNRGKKDWKGQYRVAILDDKGKEIGSGEREASIDEGDTSAKTRISVKMRTLDFPSAAKLSLRVTPQPN